MRAAYVVINNLFFSALGFSLGVAFRTFYDNRKGDRK